MLFFCLKPGFFPTPELPPPLLVSSAASPAVLWERAQASGDLSWSARGNVSALTQHCSSPYTRQEEWRDQFIIEAEGVKGLSSDWGASVSCFYKSFFHLKTAKWMRTCQSVSHSSQFLNKSFESPFNVLFRTPQGNIYIHKTTTGSHITRSNSFVLFLVVIFCPEIKLWLERLKIN